MWSLWTRREGHSCLKTFSCQVQTKKPRRADTEQDCQGAAAADVCQLSKMKPEVTTFILSVIRRRIKPSHFMWNLQNKQRVQFEK